MELTETQENELKTAEKNVSQVCLWKRIQTIRMRSKKCKYEHIANHMEVRPETVGVWIRTYQKEGLSALLTWNYKGKSASLQPKDLEAILVRHKVCPFRKVEELQAFITSQFNMDFHPVWIRALARNRLGINFREERKKAKTNAQKVVARYLKAVS